MRCKCNVGMVSLTQTAYPLYNAMTFPAFFETVPRVCEKRPRSGNSSYHCLFFKASLRYLLKFSCAVFVSHRMVAVKSVVFNNVGITVVKQFSYPILVSSASMYAASLSNKPSGFFFNSSRFNPRSCASFNLFSFLRSVSKPLNPTNGLHLCPFGSP